MKKSHAYYAAAVPIPEMPHGFWATFGIPGKPPQWVIERAERKVFTDIKDAELAAFKVMMMCLNNAAVAQDFAVKRTDKNKIRGFRAEDTGKGSGPIVPKTSEAAHVFSRFRD